MGAGKKLGRKKFYVKKIKTLQNLSKHDKTPKQAGAERSQAQAQVKLKVIAEVGVGSCHWSCSWRCCLNFSCGWVVGWVGGYGEWN